MDWFVRLQAIVPQHFLSRLAGHIAACEWTWVAQGCIGLFRRLYPVDLHEAERENVDLYKSFNDFFTRRLKDGARPITSDDATLISPADGAFAACGPIQNNQLVLVKGRGYSLASLLSDAEYAAAFEGGSLITIYLAPHNYHRVHFPCSASVQRADLIPGRLFSVNTRTEAALPDLFVCNQRLVCRLVTEHGPLAVVMVGAMIVGAIGKCFELNRSYSSGAELGYFELGSTVILCTTKGRFSPTMELSRGQPVRMGEALGRFLPSLIQD